MATESAAMSDAEWAACERARYERQRIKPAAMRESEAARRAAGITPPTLMEAVEAHLRARPRMYGRTFAPRDDDAAHLKTLAAIFTDDPALIDLGEAAALEPRERMRRYGYLVNVPYEIIDTLPAHVLADDYRFDWPEWSVKGSKYDQLRDEYLVEILERTMDKRRADLIIAGRKYDAKMKRGYHPDEANLTTPQKATLRRLRKRLTHAEESLAQANDYQRPYAERYVASSREAVRRARVGVGLMADEA